jgi:hypothetical protein
MGLRRWLVRSLLLGSLALSCGLVFSAPAWGSSVTGASLIASSLSVGATRNSVAFQFLATTGLSSSGGTVTATVPTGGSFGEDVSHSCGSSNADCIVLDKTTDTASTASWQAGAGTSVTINDPIDIAPGDTVVVSIGNVANGSTIGSTGYTVATSADTTPVTFSSQTLVAETSVSHPSLTVSSLAGGATNATLTARFTASDALTFDVITNDAGNQGRALADPASITLTAPGGSSFSQNSSHDCNGCELDDLTAGTEGGVTWLGGTGATLVLGVTGNISAGDVVRVIVPGLSNPPSTGDGTGFSFWTSSDPGPVSPVVSQTLTVSLAGFGSGTVSDGGALNCPGSCQQTYNQGTVVTLSATPAAGSAFDGWKGAGCSGRGTCSVAMTAVESVTATFDPTLTVTKGGRGFGTVTSSVPGIDCGPACTAGFGSGGQVSLTASPAAGSSFVGWFGAGCEGTGTCLASTSSTQRVVAVFDAPAATRPPGPGLTRLTFGAVGESRFVVPPGDSRVTITAVGAQGAAGYSSFGGFGAAVTGTVPVTPGETLYIEVGGAASNGGGGGGGAAGAGGGASDVRMLPRSDGLTPTDSRLVVAGGGGGGGDGFPGSVGGVAGSAPTGGTPSPGGGGPGGSTSGGTAGTSDVGCSAADAGGLGVGGAGGGTTCHGGGGGGGGYYGGGGGGGADAAVGDGGGAGSSFVEPASSGSSIEIASQAAGEVTLTYQIAPPTARVVTPGSGGTYTQGLLVRTSFSCAEASGAPGISSCADSTGHSGRAGTHSGSLDTTTLGAHRYTVTARSSDGQSGTASITYTVVKRPRPALSNLSITPHAFRASQRGVTITQNPRVGARISYRDSQASLAMFTVYRRTGTRRCSSHPHTGCPRLALVGTFRHTDKAGLNSLRFSGRIKGRALGSGDYQLNLNAKLGGQTGNTATATFRILAR